MKPMHFTVPQTPQRRHRALFDANLPFRGRVEKSKNQYQRRNKHPNRDEKHCSE